MFFSHKIGLCVRDPLEREGFGHEGRYAPALDVFDQICEHLGFQDRTTEQAQILQIEGPDVQFDDRTANRTGHGVASSRAERVEMFRPLCPPN